MASSAHKQQQQLPNIYGAATATAAPPPTPSTLPNNHLSTSGAAADALSKLLHRLPPTLSLPTRRSPSATSPPLASLSDPNLIGRLQSSFSQLGYFQLTNHDISSQLARSAESESLGLFELEKDKKDTYFPKNWPLGFEADDEEDEEGNGESFCLDSTCSTESTELSLASLRELIGAMEKVGLKIIEMLSTAVGFENPLGKDPAQFCSLMWISQGLHGDKPVLSGGFYPYVVGLQYQIRHQKYSLLADSGRVVVLPQVDSILVTLGDIAQQRVGFLLFIPKAILTSSGTGQHEIIEDDHIHGSLVTEEEEEEEETLMFESFDFEDYAWRVYHERLHLKDPLDRYRI
ncbi:hypothetical protein Patl1_06629 [Pistacia atlantica]|uniref:Uncharacterized protein n=1 Tax=Pistacia atlantica TaxID=434234 RepID=A0ACC1BPM1_9ROSI|nr:hypothetical protein Patl1_06629 [Pistacia atlantica]